MVTKRKNDKKIKTHLETIRQILPRLERWKGTYNHKAMQQVVFDTYLAVINFSRAAVEYFSHAWKRILSSVFPHVMDEFEEAAKLIYVTLAKVNAEANQSLHERSRQIQDDLSKLRIETRELKATLDARVQQDEIRDKQVDEDSFAEFESLFQVSPLDLDRSIDIYGCAKLTFVQPNLAMDTSRLDVADAALASHPCFDLSLAKSSLQAAFPNVTEYDKRKHWSLYTQLAPANILNDDSFKLWSNSGSSSLLFIHGRTMRDGRARTFQSPCWLSPAAIHIFEHLRHQNTPQDTIIYLSCRPDAEYHIEQSADVLSMVALRLISTRKQMLRSRLREFRSLVSPKSSTPLGTPSPSWSNSDRGLGLSSLSYVSSDMHHSPEEYHVEWNNEPAEKQVRRPDLRQLASLLSQVLVELATSQAQELNEKSQGPATAVILLDRLEYVDNGKFQKIMNQLARLVAEDALFRVKIVVVVEDSLAEATWRKDMLPFTSDRIHEFKLDQRRLERHEVLAGEPSLIWNGTE